MTSRKAKDAMGLPQGWRPSWPSFIFLGLVSLALYFLDTDGIVAGVVSLIAVIILMLSLYGCHQRWAHFAREHGLVFLGRLPIHPGVVTGQHRNRGIHFRRRRGLGDRAGCEGQYPLLPRRCV